MYITLPAPTDDCKTELAYPEQQYRTLRDVNVVHTGVFCAHGHSEHTRRARIFKISEHEFQKF